MKLRKRNHKRKVENEEREHFYASIYLHFFVLCQK
jgi:hypothetical protein